MNRKDAFPIPFKSLRTIKGGKAGSYMIGAMFTAGYAEKAERLAASCARLALPYVLHEVPTVHRSISSRGTDDLSYTKPNFIRHLLVAYKRPILYVDADVEFVSQPTLIGKLIKSRCDFAIYNWFADENTYRFFPIEVCLSENEVPVSNRFYRFHGDVRWRTSKQLSCSGCAQFYGNSIAARALLSKWHRTIAAFPGCADDPCLDFAFNNLTRRSWLWWLLKAQWLPKSYARYAWWLQTEPVINHPDVPAGMSGFIPIKDPKGRQRFYGSLMEPRNPYTLFPPDCIIDTEQNMVCKLVDGKVVPVESIDPSFWLGYRSPR